MECNNEFYSAPHRMKTKILCCSRECASIYKIKHNTTKIKKNCPVCNTLIIDKAYRFKNTKISCCSKKCRAEYLKTGYVGILNPNSKYKTPMELFFGYKVRNIQYAAKKRNIFFSLTMEDLIEQYNKQKGLCYYTGIHLKMLTTENFKYKNQPDFDVLSVDRVNNEEGYVKENIVLCINAVNKMKGIFPLETLNYIFDKIVEKRKSNETN